MADTTTEQLAATGLSSAEVAERVAAGKVNIVPDAPSRTVGQIVRSNVFTRFNLLMGILFAIVASQQAWKDGLFGGVIVANVLVGIVQELRAKHTLDQLAVLNAPKAHVVRDGKVEEVGVSTLVLDDIVELKPGLQIVADGEVLTDELEADESLLTGESDPVVKRPGDQLLSGSFVVAGTARAKVTKVGAEAYAVKLAEEARRFTLVRSELRGAVDRIVGWIGFALVPIGIGLFISQVTLDGVGTHEGLIRSVGGVVAMVPEGLVLLTSVAFAVGVVRLARQRTLVQELPAIEVLARVDVVCLDKTGTLTTGSMSVVEVRTLEGSDPDAVEEALGALAWSDPNPNPTQLALQRHHPDRVDRVSTGSVPFSSSRKWSAQSFERHGSFVIGAPEMAMGDGFGSIQAEVETEAEAGRRVLLLAHSERALSGNDLPADLHPLALVMLEDEVRPDAADTLRFFTEQGVTLKVISGDNPTTVGAVAMRAGLDDIGEVFDARNLPGEGTEELADVLEKTTVFGRVSPHQKRAMVKALQSRGHTVAMTGDGVNDVLALKDADCGIAMASGSAATRAVAQLVLLDSNFAGLPRAVAEGRRVINNIERVASLFLTKTTYALLLAVLTVVAREPFPFLPRHLTLVGTLTIGLPAFFLALAPNDDRVGPGFLHRVVRFASPAGLIAAAVTFAAYLDARAAHGTTPQQAQTAATLVLASVAIIVLARIARPLAVWKVGLVIAMAAFIGSAIVVAPLRHYFELDMPPTSVRWFMAAMVALAALAMKPAAMAAQRIADRISPIDDPVGDAT